MTYKRRMTFSAPKNARLKPCKNTVVIPEALSDSLDVTIKGWKRRDPNAAQLDLFTKQRNPKGNRHD